jgi:hypothetical protein
MLCTFTISLSQISVLFAHIHGSIVILDSFQQSFSLSLIPQAEERHVGGPHTLRSNISRAMSRGLNEILTFFNHLLAR